uniref:Putative endodeoxyribonuclease n=1 Tax=viral metagenome TaxID=1070528 RepID=A0A6M3XK74_9ZZZZ
MIKITIPGKPVPKERMTHNQVIAATRYNAPGKKFDRIRKCLEYQKAIAALCCNKRIKGNVKMTARIYLKPDATGQLPKQRGDLDNYIKSIKDGLQYGVVFAPQGKNKAGNDKCVIRYGEGTGIYSDENERVEIELVEV